MTETARMVFTHFSDEILIIVAAFAIIVFVLLIAFWNYNRKKFRALSYQIPASVVKNYLDSIIQNSTALKSSLFRGNGLEMGEGIPSVMPLGRLGGGENVAVSSGNNSEELAQKNAEIASLRAQLAEKRTMISDLEARLADMGASGDSVVVSLRAENATLRAENERLKKQLRDAQSSAGGDASVKIELDSVKKERDSLFERLQEYEIIEDDLANLKKLQQENEQLRRALENAKGGVGADLGVGAAAIAAAAAVSEVAPEPELELEPAPTPAPEPVAASPAPAPEMSQVSPEENPQIAGEEKSAEDLLSEFEKMLG